MPAFQKYRKGAHAYLPDAEYLGKELGQRYRVAARFYGDASEKTGAGAGFAAVYPDAYRGGISDAEGGVTKRERARAKGAAEENFPFIGNLFIFL